jgi:hypothetical protein
MAQKTRILSPISSIKASGIPKNVVQATKSEIHLKNANEEVMSDAGISYLVIGNKPSLVCSLRIEIPVGTKPMKRRERVEASTANKVSAIALDGENPEELIHYWGLHVSSTVSNIPGIIINKKKIVSIAFLNNCIVFFYLL